MTSYSCCSLSLNTGLLGAADLAALALSCRRLRAVAEDVLYIHNRDHEGSSAVHWAAEHGNVATLGKALKYGLDINEATLLHTPRLSPLQTAVVHGRDSAVAWLLDHGVDLTREVRSRCNCRDCMTCVLHTAFCLGHGSTAQLLVSRGAPLEYKSSRPEYAGIWMTNALLEASLHGLGTVVEALVEDYDMDLQTRNWRGMNSFDALGWAALNDNNVSTIRTLVSLGADVDGSDGKWTSVHSMLP